MKQFKITAPIFLEYLLFVMSNNFVSTPNNEDLLRKVCPVANLISSVTCVGYFVM